MSVETLNKTTLACCADKHDGFFSTLLEKVKAAYTGRFIQQRKRNDLAYLSQLDDRLLDDLGLTRDQVERDLRDLTL